MSNDEANIATVRALFDAYRVQDRDRADELLAPEFVFTSPQDDRIDKAEFFARCFPTADRFLRHELVELVPSANGADVFVLYEYQPADGDRYRNVEVITVRDGRITETQVFFGGRLH
jgi:ketosteroid isomerase-like protein